MAGAGRAATPSHAQCGLRSGGERSSRGFRSGDRSAIRFEPAGASSVGDARRRGAASRSWREGRVEVVNTSGAHSGVAGEQLVIPRDGAITRTAISPHDPTWQWVTRVAPGFDIDRQPLASFLDWIARETGKQIDYATPDVRA